MRLTTRGLLICAASLLLAVLECFDSDFDGLALHLWYSISTGDSHRRRQERAKEAFAEVDKELGSCGGDRPSQTQEDGWAQTKYVY
jgi:hypothetical protein